MTLPDGTVVTGTMIAGHVSVGDWAILGGFTGVHQFVRVGAHSFCGVGTVLLQDLPPFVTVSGNPASPHGINSEGLKRRGFDADRIAAFALLNILLDGIGVTNIHQTVSTVFTVPLSGLHDGLVLALGYTELSQTIWFFGVPFMATPFVGNSAIRAAGSAFAPAVIMEQFDRGFDALQMFTRLEGINGDTMVRGFCSLPEKKMSDILLSSLQDTDNPGKP